MEGFQEMIEDVGIFCSKLVNLGYSQTDALEQWVKNAPMVWLGKCRETALDNIRTSLAKGIGESRPVEKIEKQMVSVAEGNELATTGAGASADTNDWGAEWGAEWDENDEAMDTKMDVDDAPAKRETSNGADEDDGADAWGWGDEDDSRATDAPSNDRDDKANAAEEDDSAAAWGWGDEDQTMQEPKRKIAPPAPEQTRELVLKETYHISSMPDPVMELISRILEDGATLTRGEDRYGHVANTAPGLFSLPTFSLALFRAISPHYYPVDEGGSM
jgi:centromere/kinetochore protein ZW10